MNRSAANFDPMQDLDLLYGGSPGGDAQQSIDLLHYWRIIRKHLFGIIGLALAVGLLALLVANSMTPIYSARTTVSIELRSPATSASVDTSWYFMSKYPGTQFEILKSRAVAQQVVENLKLWEHPWFNQPHPPSGFSWRKLLPGSNDKEPEEKAPLTEKQQQEKLEAKKNSLAGMIQGGITVTPMADTFIVAIGFSSPSPEIAALVANAVVDAYVQRNLEERFREVKKVSEWIDESLGGITSQLQSAEEKLQQYSAAEDIVATTGEGATALDRQRLDDLYQRLTEKRIELNELIVLKQQVDKFRGMTLEEMLDTPAIYRHPTLKKLKDSEQESVRQIKILGERYGPKHPKMIQAETDLNATRERYRQAIPLVVQSIDGDVSLFRKNLNALQREYDAQRDRVKQVNVKEFELERLQRDLDANRKLRNLFIDEYKQTNISSNFEPDRVRVVDPAKVPGSPSKPNKRRIILMSVLMALLAGIGLAFLIEFLDQTIKSSDDIEQKLALPVLGMLTQLSRKKTDSKIMHPERVYIEEDSSNFAETIRTIRTGITLSALDKPHKIILFTSSVPGEGKTTAACNVALAMSQLEKTLIFDADLRRPSTKKIFDYDHQSPGMTELLSGEAEFKDVIHKVADTNLHVITAGRIPPDPLDMLASKKFASLLESMAKRYDRVIIDSPPVSLVSDPVLLSSLADTVVFVVKYDSTNTKVINNALNKLRQAKAHITGIILNNTDMKKMSRYYGYGYGKYYAGGAYAYGEEYKKS